METEVNLKFNVCEEEDTKDRVDVEEKEQESTDVCEGRYCHYDCLKEDLDLAGKTDKI